MRHLKALYILQANSTIEGCDGSKAVPARPSAKDSVEARTSRQNEETLIVFACSSTGKKLSSWVNVSELNSQTCTSEAAWKACSAEC